MVLPTGRIAAPYVGRGQPLWKLLIEESLKPSIAIPGDRGKLYLTSSPHSHVIMSEV